MLQSQSWMMTPSLRQSRGASGAHPSQIGWWVEIWPYQLPGSLRPPAINFQPPDDKKIPLYFLQMFKTILQPPTQCVLYCTWPLFLADYVTGTPPPPSLTTEPYIRLWHNLARTTTFAPLHYTALSGNSTTVAKAAGTHFPRHITLQGI